MQLGYRANAGIRGAIAAPLIALMLALLGQAAADVTGWAREDTMPLGPHGKMVKDGGALAFCPGLGGGCLYALKGNNTNEFYRYDIAGRFWAAQESLPPIQELKLRRCQRRRTYN